MYIDSHCHLNFPQLRSQISHIRAAMQQAHVNGALIIAITLEEFDEVYQLATAHNNFWASVGVHPDEENAREPTLTDLTQRAQLPKVLAVGETGLDYYRLNGRTIDDMQWQRDRFCTHIHAAQQTNKPLIIHTRSAIDDTLSILRAEIAAQPNITTRGVFHCFTEDINTARAALDLGFYISFSGIVTFRNAQNLRDIAAFVPLDRLLIETDSPYLAPTPYRGKTNIPAYVAHVAETIAQCKSTTPEQIGKATTENFKQLFQPV